jgi:hypothetical protein
MKYFCFIIVLTTQIGCSQNMSSKNLFEQYAYLLENSFKFSQEEKGTHLIFRADEYIKSYKTENFDFLTTRLHRSEYIILQPFLLNNRRDKGIILVLTRDMDLNDTKVERVHFLSVKYADKKWELRFHEGYVRSFGYEGNAVTLSDQEIFLRVLRNLIDNGYLKGNTCEINDNFFETDSRYVLK